MRTKIFLSILIVLYSFGTLLSQTEDKEYQLLEAVSKNDEKTFKVGNAIRLMELFNIKIHEVTPTSVLASFLSESYKEARGARLRLIHWILGQSSLSCQVVMPDALILTGLAEDACNLLESNSIIQFERFGFVRIDEINREENGLLKAYFAHK